MGLESEACLSANLGKAQSLEDKIRCDGQKEANRRVKASNAANEKQCPDEALVELRAQIAYWHEVGDQLSRGDF